MDTAIGSGVSLAQPCTDREVGLRFGAGIRFPSPTKLMGKGPKPFAPSVRVRTGKGIFPFDPLTTGIAAKGSEVVAKVMESTTLPLSFRTLLNQMAKVMKSMPLPLSFRN